MITLKDPTFEKEELPFNILLCSTGAMSLICYVVAICWSRKNKSNVKVTAGFKTFGSVATILYIITPLSSIGTSVYSMVWDSFYSMTSLRARLSLAFATQIADLSVIILSIDVAVASLRRSQMPLLQTKLHGLIAAFVCVVMASFICYVYFISRMNFPIPFSIWVMGTHVICLLIEVLLLNRNLRRHKIVPFNYSVSARLNLARNIGLLKLFYPYLFLMTILTSIGALLFIFVHHGKFFYMSQLACVSIFYSFYNITHIMITIIFIWSSAKQNRQPTNADIKGATGKVINLRQTAEEHFQQLHDQWN